MEELPSIQQLENFIAYGKLKNFTLAAKDMNITQSAFSLQIKKLEDLLDVKLIVRSNRGSKLTAEGEFFFEEIDQWMNGLHKTIYDVRNLNKQYAGELHVGVLSSLGDVLMNQHVAYFKKYNKNIAINVYDMEEEDLLLELKNDAIDIASTFLVHKEDEDLYEQVKFCTDKIVYYAPNTAGDQTSISLAEMTHIPFVQYPPKYFMHTLYEEYFSTRGKFPPLAAILSSPYAMIHYCQQNTVGALLPERLLQVLDIKDGYFSIEPELNLDAYLVYKKNNPKYKMMKIFIDYVMDLNQKIE
jgi:DNA-binding transcriptional LysR family regulator